MPQIQGALLADDDDSLVQLVHDLDVARQLYSPQYEKPVNTILSFLNLLESINSIRTNLTAEEHVKPRLNALFELAYQNIAYTFPEELLDDALLTTDYLLFRIQNLYDKVSGQTPAQHKETARLAAIDNQRIRLGGLYESIKICHDSQKYTDGMPSDVGETVSQQEADKDSQYIAELFNTIRASQRYGIKMGYTSENQLGGALLFSPPLSAKEFSDTEALQSAYHPLLDKTDTIAQIVHTQKKHHRRIKATLLETQGHSAVSFSGLGPGFLLNLGPDGELYTWRDCRVSLRDIALQKGKYEAYRTLQANVLAHYFDLTHSLEEVVRITKTLREQPPQVSHGTRPALESIERLVVPRIKRYAESTATDQAAYSVRRHNVVWHIRKLPEGWNPSPAAFELAKKLGVTLEKNETIVKEHKRGTRVLGQITAHRFASRPADDDMSS